MTIEPVKIVHSRVLCQYKKGNVHMLAYLCWHFKNYFSSTPSYSIRHSKIIGSLANIYISHNNCLLLLLVYLFVTVETIDY